MILLLTNELAYAYVMRQNTVATHKIMSQRTLTPTIQFDPL